MFKIFRRKIFSDIINEKIGSFIFKLLSFILIVFLARILTHEEFGAYNLLISLAIIISYFTSFGIPVAIVRYLSEYKNSDEVLGFFLRLLIIINLITLIILAPLSKKISGIFLKNGDLYYLVLISLIISVVVVFYNTTRSTFVANKRFDIYRNLFIAEGTFKLFLIIFLAYFLSLLGALIGFLLSYILILIISLLYIKTVLKIRLNFSSRFNPKGLYRYLIFLNMSTAIRSIYAWVDSLIIAYMLDVKSLSFYRVSQSLTGALIGLTGLQTVFSPRFASWDLKTIRRRLPLIFALNLSITIPIVLFLYTFGNDVIKFIYGDKYIYSYELLKPFLLLLILNSFSYFTTIFNMKGKSEYTSFVSIVMSVSNIILDIILIKIYGLIGAVYATVISWFISLLLAFIIFVKKFTS